MVLLGSILCQGVPYISSLSIRGNAHPKQGPERIFSWGTSSSAEEPGWVAMMDPAMLQMHQIIRSGYELGVSRAPLNNQIRCSGKPRGKNDLSFARG